MRPDSTEKQASGVDLARVALRAAKEVAKARGSAAGDQKPTRRSRVVRGDGRDPVGLGSAITALMAERAWEAPAAGGSVLDHWAGIVGAVAPKLAGHVAAEAFAADSGRLDVRPTSPAYGTELRWCRS